MNNTLRSGLNYGIFVFLQCNKAKSREPFSATASCPTDGKWTASQSLKIDARAYDSKVLLGVSQVPWCGLRTTAATCVAHASSVWAARCWQENVRNSITAEFQFEGRPNRSTGASFYIEAESGGKVWVRRASVAPSHPSIRCLSMLRGALGHGKLASLSVYCSARVVPCQRQCGRFK